MSWPTVGDTLQREPKVKGARFIVCLETLRQKDYRKEFLWREPRVGAPKGQDRRGVISQVKGQRLDLLKTDYASVFFMELLGNDKARSQIS